MNETKLSKYYKFLESLKIPPLDSYKLYFWPLEEGQQKFRPGRKYLDEYRKPFLDFKYVQNIDYHKCIGRNGESYILFPDTNRILIDPFMSCLVRSN